MVPGDQVVPPSVVRADTPAAKLPGPPMSSLPSDGSAVLVRTAAERLHRIAPHERLVGERRATVCGEEKCGVGGLLGRVLAVCSEPGTKVRSRDTTTCRDGQHFSGVDRAPTSLRRRSSQQEQVGRCGCLQQHSRTHCRTRSGSWARSHWASGAQSRSGPRRNSHTSIRRAMALLRKEFCSGRS